MQHSDHTQHNPLYLRTLVGLAIIYTLYFAQSLLIPIVFSVFIALLLNPLVALLKGCYVPRPVSAIVLLALLITPFSFLTNELVEPAQKWAKLIPKMTVQLSDQIDSLSDEFAEHEQRANEEVKQQEQEESGFNFFGWFSDDEETPEPAPQIQENAVKERIKQGGIEVLVSVLGNAPVILAQWLASVILILFLLIYGPAVFKVVTNEFPVIKNKQQMASIANKIQQVLSRYIVTISVINALLGMATALAFSIAGVEDALLWGVLVALFNFVPYVGSLISVSILCLAGLVQYELSLLAMLPASIFLGINIIESQFITPTVLGNKMNVNPLVIIFWLSILGWMWGILGVLLAVPMLVCIKLILGETGTAPHWAKLIEAK